ncbi:uncharacterized protein [Setaria viridis]|uniref:uncharacterized protein n=1 Tax=Setaria viridis TaxID=4556 RepID=UPI003B3B528F
MAPTATQEEGGQASGSRSRAGRRHTPTPAVTDSPSGAFIAAGQEEKIKATPEESERERWKRKRARAAADNRGADEEVEKKGARSTEAAAAADSASTGEWHPSSAHVCAWNQLKLVTIDPYVPRSCMVTKHLVAVRESATEIVLEGAKVIFSFSSNVDGELMAQSSGFLIDWDEDSKMGTVLTSALLICTKYPSLDKWLATGEYLPNAELSSHTNCVCVHLLDKDETTVPARLLHYDKHFNIDLFKVHVDSCAKIPSFNSEVRYGQEVSVLGRDKDLNLNINHGRVQFNSPTIYEIHHYMFMGCIINQFGIGGPVIDFNGQVFGVVSIPGMGFIHSSIILKCLDMWKKFDCVPWLHIRMKFSAMKFLDPARVENIFHKCNISSGLIVAKVSLGSVVEKSGIIIGDIIVSINRECIATTVEVDVFHTLKGSTRTINLRLNITDEVEVFAKGNYLVSARDCA